MNNKFIGKKTTVKAKPKEKQKEVLASVHVFKKGEKQFLICPKCGWTHAYNEEKCRFCGQVLRG